MQFNNIIENKNTINHPIDNDESKNNTNTKFENIKKRKCFNKASKNNKKHKEINTIKEQSLNNTINIHNTQVNNINVNKIKNENLDLTKLPVPVLNNIFIFLKNPKDWKSVSETCKRFNTILNKPFVLKQLFEKIQERNFKIVDKENEFYKIEWILKFAKKFPEHITHLNFHGLTLQRDLNGRQVDFDQEELDQFFSSLPNLNILNLTDCKGNHVIWRIAALKSKEQLKKPNGMIKVLYSKLNKQCEQQIIRVKNQCFFLSYPDFKRQLYNPLYENIIKIQDKLIKTGSISYRFIAKWERGKVNGFCKRFFPSYTEEIMKEFFKNRCKVTPFNDNENHILQSYPPSINEHYRNRSNEFLEFEGEYINNKPNGHGTFYYLNGNLRYTGEFKNGKFEGKGEMFNEKGELFYKGDFVNGKFHGLGIIYNEDSIYEGNFNNGSLSGYTIVYNKNKRKTFEGSFENEALNGEGKSFHRNGTLKYAGNFRNNLYSGKGKIYSRERKLVYEGKFSEGKYHGNGILYLPNGNFYKADFRDGKLDGFFCFYDSNKKKIKEGLCKDGIVHGWVRTFYTNGNVKCQAEIAQGKVHGKVIEYKENGEKEESRYENGIKIN